MSTESVLPSNHLIFYPSLPSPFAFNLSQHQGHSQWVGSLYQVSEVLELQLQHQSLQWILVSFRIDWFDLLAVHGTLKTLLQHYDSKDLIFWRSAFFMVQLSHPHMTNGKTIVLTIQTLVSNVMSLLFNTIIAFLLFSFAPLVSPPQFGKTTWLYLGKQGAYRTQTQHWSNICPHLLTVLYLLLSIFNHSGTNDLGG